VTAGEQLKRALGDHLVHFAGAIAIEAPVSRRWASVTFSGERHRLRVYLGGAGAAAAADAFLDGLDEREFALRGHILADIALVGDEREGDAVRLTLEALTVEAD
jgi:hypothetical protein